jgi:uncharacterized protein
MIQVGENTSLAVWYLIWIGSTIPAMSFLKSAINLSPQSILSYNYGTYKGYFAENYLAQELLTSLQKPLYSWQENRAEIEFLCEMDEGIIPIEVKSGWVTHSKSLIALS